MRAAFCTLGCKVNSYDSSMMGQALKDAGYEIVDFDELADVYIINSCTVTGTGDKKSRQMVHRAKKMNPKAIVCMAGCLAQTAAEDVTKLGVDLIVGTSQKSRIVDLIEQARSNKVVAIEELSAYEDCFKTLQDDRTRGFLKIQDGCDRFCTYCIIPYARGKSKSRNLASIITEAKELVKDGYKEIVLTGIHIASYGKDIGGGLLEVVKEVSKVCGVERIRLGSIEPLILTDDFCHELSKISQICPAFHVSMQSGCDNTLKAMGRKYNSAKYANSIFNLRKYFPNCAITTDVIVGFPKESDDDFNECLEFVKNIGFSKCHVFPYSRRKGTGADRMDGHLEKAIKQARAKEMSRICKAMEQDYIESQLNKEDMVLFEKEEDGIAAGYTTTYIRVYCIGEDLEGKIKRVKLIKKYKDGIFAQII